MRNSILAAIFFLVTATALALAMWQIVLAFYGHSPELAAAVGELLLVIVLGIGEILAFVEVRHVGKEREFHSWLRAQEVWTETTFREARGKIFQRLQNNNQTWTVAEKEEAKNVCRRMDEFAHLVPFLGQRRMLDVWDDPLAKGWIVLEDIVREERQISGWPTKWSAFEKLGQRALSKLVREHRDPRGLRSKPSPA